MTSQFKAMIHRFGEPVTIRRTAAGTYDSNGEWVPGSTSDIAAIASIQPAKGAQLAFLDSNQRTGEEMTVYIDTQVFTSKADDGTPADLILWNGEEFKILTVKRWLMTQVYWEAVAVRRTEL